MTGAAGMLGHKVAEHAAALGHDVVAADIAQFDLTDRESTRAFVADVEPAAISASDAAVTHTMGSRLIRILDIPRRL